ncbi:MAG: hypothetical protein K8J31_30780 [Anaerolineae bacterium]|nr:hypothetical protein [Anaerolineae bacterium]
MTALETAILRTILYADLFDFPMTVAEIHHFLIHDEAVSRAEIEAALRESPWLQQRLVYEAGHIFLADRPELLVERAHRAAVSAYLWPQAVAYGKWLGRLPFVRMVALTGALAMRNAADQTDDLDYLLVTAPNRVWLARAFAILLVRLVRLRGTVICPNYVLAEDALEQDRRDVFIAHEIAQMIPLYGQALYERFRALNDWSRDHLPQAQAPLYPEPDQRSGSLWERVKMVAEGLLNGRFGDALEHWEYQRKLRRFAADMQAPHSAAQLDRSHVKGHFNDYGHPVLRRYAERLREYGLEEVHIGAPGE